MKYLTVFMVLVRTFSLAQTNNLAEQISPLLIGEKVPEAQVRSADNAVHELTAIVSQRPTVLLFYRGGWCPYCNAHLSEIRHIEKEIIDMGYQIVAVSPDAPENIKITEDEKNIGYQLYSDAKGELIKAMGIAFKAPERYAGLLEKKSNGLNEGFLPVPSVFILDKSGKILFEYINPDYKTRLSGKLLIAVLKNL